MLEFWDSTPFIQAANILVAADDPLRALDLLDNVPAYYRENYPAEMQEVKSAILAKLATPTFYQEEEFKQLPDPEIVVDTVKDFLRWQLIKDEVLKLNSQGIKPHIIELGPGSFWLPIGLHKSNLDFTYFDIGLNPKHLIKEYLGEKYQPKAPDTKIIYVACEIIEHLHFERDIATEIYRLGVKPDIIHLSTPQYTYDVRKERLDWRNHGTLGHLRTYTLTDFGIAANKLFPGYKLTLYNSQVMHIRAER